MIVRQSKFWRGYFVLFTLVTIAGLFWPLLSSLFPQLGLETSLLDFGFSVWATIELLGLYGFMFSRQIGSRNIWKLVFFTSVSFAFYSVYDPLTDFHLEGDGIEFIGIIGTVATAVIVLFVPLWIALYRYAWTERQLWVSRT